MADLDILCALVNASPHGQLVLDKHWRVVLWNSWMESKTGIEATKAIGTSIHELFGESDLASRLKAGIRAGLKDGQSSWLTWAFTPHPFPLKQSANSDRPMVQNVSICIHGNKESARYCLIVIEDHTEDHEREMLLIKRSRELERLNANLSERNKHLDDFSRQASHDLQEPLRKVRAFTDMLVEDLGPKINADAANDMLIINDAVTRMSVMVEGLLLLSRMGHEPLRLTEGSMRDTVDGAMDLLELKIEQTRASIKVQELPMVSADHGLMGTVFQNLLGNAMKFYSGACPELEVTHEYVGGEDVFGVKDNGIGIESDRPEQIFEPFTRLHGRTEYPGSGIGLSICKRAIVQHGGRIWVESPPGSGAHFKFVLNQAG